MEWLTVAALLAASARAWVVRARLGHAAARRVWCALALATLFGALEEVSYGQRLLGVRSPEWFQLHNTQGETNLHNLRVGGVKLNRLVFGKGLVAAVACYLLVLPALYRRSESWRARFGRWALPLPRGRHAAAWATAALVAWWLREPHNRAGELGEMAGGVVFLLILLDPLDGPP
ncbi:MAG: hypothetical protein HY722_15205 [Planctomycetes bacterium]|nr:hypothetical protein [Planctomycetota bacterium]